MAKLSIKEIYKKYYSPESPIPNSPKMRFIPFLLDVCVDPTSSPYNDKANAKVVWDCFINNCLNWNFVNKFLVKGRYVQWVINHRNEFNIASDNNDTSVAVTEALRWFDQNKSFLEENDIHKLNVAQLLELKDKYNGMDLSLKHAVDKAEMKGAEMVYCDSDWAIVVPKTFEASCFYGQYTKWCTTERLDPSYFENYSKEGPLYILIDRHHPNKYQFYFVNGKYDFRNEIDNSVFPWDVDMTEGARNFFKQVSGSKGLTTAQLNQLLAKGNKPEDIFDKVYPASFNRQMVRLDMRYNYINTITNQLVGPQWYFFAFPYREGPLFADGVMTKVWIQRFTFTYIGINGVENDDQWVEDYDVDAWKNKEYWE